MRFARLKDQCVLAFLAASGISCGFLLQTFPVFVVLASYALLFGNWSTLLSLVHRIARFTGLLGFTFHSSHLQGCQ